MLKKIKQWWMNWKLKRKVEKEIRNIQRMGKK